jgi:RNA polymerase sigma factor (sigma-70 family)
VLQSDERLVALTRAGHDGAFEAIVERYRPQLLALARRLSSDGEAEDLVQQAFLHAFVALRSGTEVAHLRGWLHRILRNTAFSAYARAHAHDAFDGHGATVEALSDIAEQRLLAVTALGLVADLPARQRDAFVGTAIHGRTRAEVAYAMGLSEGAVRQLVHRARARLRSAISVVVPYPVARWLAATRTQVGCSGRVAELTAGTATASAGAIALKVGAAVTAGVMAAAVISSRSLHGHHAGPRTEPHVMRLGARAAARTHPADTQTVESAPASLTAAASGSTPSRRPRPATLRAAAVGSAPGFEHHGRNGARRWRSWPDGASSSTRESSGSGPRPDRMRPRHGGQPHLTNPEHPGTASAPAALPGAASAPAALPALATLGASPDGGTVRLVAESGGRGEQQQGGDGAQIQTQAGGGHAGDVVGGSRSADGHLDAGANANGDDGGSAHAASLGESPGSGGVLEGDSRHSDNGTGPDAGASVGSSRESPGGQNGVQAVESGSAQAPAVVTGGQPPTGSGGGGEQAVARPDDAGGSAASTPGGGPDRPSTSSNASTPDNSPGASSSSGPGDGLPGGSASADAGIPAGGGANGDSAAISGPAAEPAAAPAAGGSASGTSASGPS